MTRKHMLELIAQELERGASLTGEADNLPHNIAKHVADIRADVGIGPGLNAVLRAMQRVEKECDLDRP